MPGLKKVGVLGAGMMGAEIALCFAATGSQVALKEQKKELAQKGKDRLSTVLDKAIEKGRFPGQEKEATLSRITPTEEFELFGEVDLVIEAVFEDQDLKKDVLGEIDTICRPGCVIATNTSSIPITLLASTLSAERKAKFIGAHFFSPAFQMKLVEVIPGMSTSEETAEFVLQACQAIGKTPIRVKDVPGFVVNRILCAIYGEAVRLIEEGVATVEDIDTGCRLGLGHPVGPLALMDLTDISLALKVENLLLQAYGERFRPSPLLHQKVYANHLGRKTGQGWYKYDK